MGSKKTKSYDPAEIQAFLELIKTAVWYPDIVKISFNDLVRKYKLGQGNTRHALKAGGLIVVKGQGFKKWEWTGPEAISTAVALNFIGLMKEYNAGLKSKRDAGKPEKDPAPSHVQEPLFVQIPDELKPVLDELKSMAETANAAIAEIMTAIRKGYRGDRG